MSLLRCPKFLRCLTADAGNFDRGHSLTSLLLPLAALGSLPTASVRTGFAMTGFLQGVGARLGGSSGRPTPTHHSPIELRRGRRPRRPALPRVRCAAGHMGPALQPVFAGPACPAVSAGQDRRADRGVRAYGSATRGAMGGRPQGSPLRRGYKECDAGRNPPVTASPCQSPLGKGAKGTGDADCHSQCAHWPRNDSVFARNRCKAGRVIREADPYSAIHR